MQRTVLVVASLVFLTCVVACSGVTPPTVHGTASGPRPVADAELHAERDKQIQGLIDDGYFQKVEPGKANSKPMVWVTPKFMALDYAEKQTAVLVVAGFYYKIPASGTLQDGEGVVLIDSKTGKLVGGLSKSGLRMD